MIARSTPARYPVMREVSPLYRPKSSTTAIRSCEPVEVRRLWMNCTPRVTAVEKPMQ